MQPENTPKNPQHITSADPFQLDGEDEDEGTSTVSFGEAGADEDPDFDAEDEGGEDEDEDEDDDLDFFGAGNPFTTAPPSAASRFGGPASPPFADDGGQVDPFQPRRTAPSQPTFAGMSPGMEAHPSYQDYPHDPSSMPPLVSWAKSRERWYQIRVEAENAYGQRDGLGILPATATEHHLIERNKGQAGTFFLTPIDRNGRTVGPIGYFETLSISENHPAVLEYRKRQLAGQAPVPSPAGPSYGGAGVGAMAPGVAELLGKLVDNSAEKEREAKQADDERLNFLLGEIKATAKQREEAARDLMALQQNRDDKVADVIGGAMQPIMGMLMGMIQMQQTKADSDRQAQQQWFQQQMMLTQTQAQQQMERLRMEADIAAQRERAFMERMMADSSSTADRAIAWSQHATTSEVLRVTEAAKEREQQRERFMQAMMQVNNSKDPASQLRALGIDYKDLIREKIEGGGQKSGWDKIFDAIPAILSMFVPQGDDVEDAEVISEVGPGYQLPDGSVVPPLYGSPDQQAAQLQAARLVAQHQHQQQAAAGQQQAQGQEAPQGVPQGAPQGQRPIGWAVPGVPVEAAEQVVAAARAAGQMPVFDQANNIVGFAPPPPDQRPEGQQGYVVEGGTAFNSPQEAPTQPAPEQPLIIEGGTAFADQTRTPALGQVIPMPQPQNMSERDAAQAIEQLRGIVATLKSVDPSTWKIVLMTRLQQAPAAQKYLQLVTVREACTHAGAPADMTERIVQAVREMQASTIPNPTVAKAINAVRAE